MITTYLDTTDSIWLDENGNFWRNTFPAMIVGGHETLRVILVTSSPGRGTAAANPSQWPRDTSWTAGAGSGETIGAMVTVDNDYLRRNRGTFVLNPSTGATSVTVSMPNVRPYEIASTGTIYLNHADGTFDAETYTSFTTGASGDYVFTLAGSLTPTSEYLDAAVPQPPLASAFVDLTQSDFSQGELVFDLVLSGSRLREMTEYSNTSGVPITGIELLFYRTITATDVVEKIRAYLLSSASLRNAQGDPGYDAEPGPPQLNLIRSAVDTALAGSTFAADLAAVEEGLSGATASIAALGTAIDGATVSIAGLTARMDTAETTIAAATASISGLTTGVAQLRSDVDANTSLLQETVLQVNMLDQEKVPLMVYVTGGTGSDITMALTGGKQWTFEQPLEGLTFSSVANSHLESEVIFTGGTALNVDIPASVSVIGEPTFAAGKSYVINVRDNMLVAAEYTPGVTE